MLTDSFKEREQALENEFFYRVDKRLQEELRKSLHDQANKVALAQASGLDESLVEELVKQGYSSESLAAIALAPLVLIAWADQTVDAKERKAVLQIAITKHLEDNSPASQLINRWLDSEPSPELFLTWKHYTIAICQKLSSEAKETLRAEILKHATDVAKSSGSILGFGRISKAEQAVLDKIEQAFDS